MSARKFATAAMELITGAFIGAALIGIIVLGVHQEQRAREIHPRAIAVAVKLAKHDVPNGITEDDPRWNCATMGDHQCGSTVIPVAPDHCFPVTLRPGITTWLEMRANGPAYCTAITGA